MDTIDTSTVVDPVDIESVHKKVKLNGDTDDNAKSVDKIDSEEEFDFSSSDLEDLDSVNSAVDETDNFSEPLKSHDNNDNQLIEAKNDNISVMGNGDTQSVVDTVVISDTSSLSKCSSPFSNECNNQVDSIVSTNGENSMNVPTVDHCQQIDGDDEPIIKSDNTANPRNPTKCEEDDAYSDEDGAIVNFLGKANEIVGLVHNSDNMCYSCDGRTVVLIIFYVIIELLGFGVIGIYYSHFSG